MSNSTPDYRAALPAASYEFCGDLGISVAVGNRAHSIVYRGTWDKKSNYGTWNFSYFREGSEGLEDPDKTIERTDK